jgi:hypothetical protein
MTTTAVTAWRKKFHDCNPFLLLFIVFKFKKSKPTEEHALLRGMPVLSNWAEV